MASIGLRPGCGSERGTGGSSTGRSASSGVLVSLPAVPELDPRRAEIRLPLFPMGGRMRSTPLVLSTAALFVLLGTLAGSGRAEDLPPGYGANAPSGSTFTSDIANPAGVVKNPTPESVDQDGYAFQGFQGMVLTATLKPGKGSGLVPNLDVVRPGGSLATYTAAGFVRRGLQAAGFQIERRAGYGQKRHMTRGRMDGTC